MTDEEWEKQRQHAIFVTFKTGRPTFADSDGELRHVGRDRDLTDPPEALYTRAMRATRVAFDVSIIGAVANAIGGFWRPWHFLYAAVMLSSALVWRYVHRLQRELYGNRR